MGRLFYSLGAALENALTPMCFLFVSLFDTGDAKTRLDGGPRMTELESLLRCFCSLFSCCEMVFLLLLHFCFSLGSASSFAASSSSSCSTTLNLLLLLCVHACALARVCICMHVRTCVRAYMRVCLYACVSVVCLCMYTCACVPTYMSYKAKTIAERKKEKHRRKTKTTDSSKVFYE